MRGVTEKLLFGANRRSAEDIETSTDPEALRIRKMVGSVLCEIYRMRGFVRLKPQGSHILYGTLRPRHRIGAYICDLLAARSPDTIIVLGNSNESWVSLCLGTRIMRSSGKGLNRTLCEISSGLNLKAEAGGEGMEEIWKVYYASQYRPKRRDVSAFHRRIPQSALDSTGLEAERNENGVTLESFFEP